MFNKRLIDIETEIMSFLKLCLIRNYFRYRYVDDIKADFFMEDIDKNNVLVPINTNNIHQNIQFTFEGYK